MVTVEGKNKDQVQSKQSEEFNSVIVMGHLYTILLSTIKVVNTNLNMNYRRFYHERIG